MEELKTCKICGHAKELTYFEKRTSSKYRPSCKSCSWQRRLIRHSASAKNERPHKVGSKLITSEFLDSLRESQNGKCYWLGINLDFTNECPLSSVSLDRLDNEKGYDPVNVVLASRFANLGRCSASASDMISFVNNLKNEH